MKRVTIAALVFIGIASIVTLAMPRQTVFIRRPAQMDSQKRIEITAQSMQRDGALMHATSNVQVRITPIHPDDGLTVIHADEVLYHGDTGEIETRGDARITIEKAQ